MADTNIGFKCSNAEKDRIKANARDSGMDMTEYILSRCLPADLVEPPAPEQEVKSSGVDGMATKAKQVQYPDMSILVDQQRRVKTYYERLEAYGVRFDWSKCTYAKERGRCAKLRVAICEACQEANEAAFALKAKFDAEQEANLSKTGGRFADVPCL